MKVIILTAFLSGVLGGLGGYLFSWKALIVTVPYAIILGILAGIVSVYRDRLDQVN